MYFVACGFQVLSVEIAEGIALFLLSDHFLLIFLHSIFQSRLPILQKENRILCEHLRKQRKNFDGTMGLTY